MISKSIPKNKIDKGRPYSKSSREIGKRRENRKIVTNETLAVIVKIPPINIKMIPSLVFCSFSVIY